MNWMFIVGFAFSITVVSASISSSKTCPRKCRCDIRKNVYCQNKKFTYVPLDIPDDTETLHLQDNMIANSQEMEDILGKLKKLKRINLSNNSLTSFPRNLPSSLSFININANKIRYIASDVFDGMLSLETLYLDNNLLTEKGVLSSSFRGASNLVHLTLTSNQLTKVPLGIPSSVKTLRLDKNKIESISKEALSQLINLSDMDLRHNILTMESFEDGAFDGLYSFNTLDLGYNKIQNIPRQLPSEIKNLLIPYNLVEYIYASKSSEHGNLRELELLSRLDLSNNKIRSVESGAFSGLETLNRVALHNNPWQCDCYLRYLKDWLSSTGLIVNYESNMKCSTPKEIQDVTLDSLDIQSMICTPDQRPDFAISHTEPEEVEISWSIHDGTNPPYANYRVMFGEMKCGNCSDYPLEDATWRKNSHASSLVKTYRIIPVEQSKANGDFVSVSLSNIKQQSSYMICLLNNFEESRTSTAQPCKFVRAQQPTPPTLISPEAENSVPLWILIFVLALILIILAVVIGIVLKKKFFMKAKFKRTHAGTNGMFYDPFRQVYTQSEPYVRSHTPTVGGTNIAHYREDDGLIQTTSDATKEFDVTLMVRPDPNHPDLLRSAHHGGSPETCEESCCSDCQNATISTNNTRTATMETMGSQIAEIDDNSISRDHCSLPYSSHSNYDDREEEYIYHTIASNPQTNDNLV